MKEAMGMGRGMRSTKLPARGQVFTWVVVLGLLLP